MSNKSMLILGTRIKFMCNLWAIYGNSWKFMLLKLEQWD